MNNKCVYRHRRLDTNEIFYVGIGNDKRPYDFKGRNPIWKRVFNKTNIEVEILYDGINKEDACELEEFLISLYGRRDLGTGTLVNLTNGGDGVNNVSDETRKKMSDAKLGHTPWNKGLQGSIPWNKGIKGSVKENITSFKKGFNPWNKNKIGLQVGEDIGTSILTEKQVLEIRSKFLPYKYTRKMLSEEYSVSEDTIKDIVLRKSWKHI